LCKRVVEEKLPRWAPKPYYTALEDAQRELESLKTRIPTLSLRVGGAPPASVRAMLDDRILSPDDLTRPVELDPGEYTLRIEARGMTPEQRRLKLVEGTHENLEVVLRPAPPPMKVEPRGSILPGAVALGVGAAGFVVGAVTGIMSLAKVGDLKAA